MLAVVIIVVWAILMGVCVSCGVVSADAFDEADEADEMAGAQTWRRVDGKFHPVDRDRAVVWPTYRIGEQE